MTNCEETCSCAAGAVTAEASTLRWLFGINAVMFIVDIVAGRVAESSNPIADSLDMFADAAV